MDELFCSLVVQHLSKMFIIYFTLISQKYKYSIKNTLNQISLSLAFKTKAFTSQIKIFTA